MHVAEKWSSLKVKESKYQALAACSEKTGRPIIQLADEALDRFIQQVVPVYNIHADQARATIEGRATLPRLPKKKTVASHPKRTQMDPIDTMSIPS